MIVLVETTDNIQIALNGVATTQLKCVTSWRDYAISTYLPGRAVTQTNNTTDVNIVPGPATGQQREVHLISVYNSDAITQTVTIKFDANGIDYTLWRGVLDPTDRLEYVTGKGFKVTTGGAEKVQQSTSIPASNTLTRVVLNADVTNNNAAANTLANITGLSFAVTANNAYYFRATIPYTAAATTTGSRWTINGPASPTVLAYTSRYPLTATTETMNYVNGYTLPATSNASSLTAGNVAVIEGVIRPSTDGTVSVQFASEVTSSAIIAKAGALLEYIQVI